jgi:hypothetical protein
MAKPILVVDIPVEQLERSSKIEEYIKTKTNNISSVAKLLYFVKYKKYLLYARLLV